MLFTCGGCARDFSEPKPLMPGLKLEANSRNTAQPRAATSTTINMTISNILRKSNAISDDDLHELAMHDWVLTPLYTDLKDFTTKLQQDWLNNVKKTAQLLPAKATTLNSTFDHITFPFNDPVKFALQQRFNLTESLPAAEKLNDEPQSSPTDSPKLSHMKPKSTVYSRDWFVENCQGHVNSISSSLSTEQLATSLLGILRSEKSDEAIQDAFVDLLGFENLDFVMELTVHRREIVENIYKVADYTPSVVQLAPPKLPTRPQYGTQVTVQTEQEKQLAKQARKHARKEAKYRHEDVSDAQLLGFVDIEFMRRVRENELQHAANAPLATGQPMHQQEKYPHVYTNNPGGSALSAFGTRYALPEGTIRNDERDYEEIRIPITKQVPPRIDERPVAVGELDAWAQSAFTGYTHLNRLQSIVYPTAFQSNENMLVCAPTGAGKTDVAMLTILRCISQFRQNGIIEKDFKVIYVAPMKALAAEIVKKFSSRLSIPTSQGGLGILVRELTGDMQMTKAEIQATQVIVTTPEKYDVVTRKSTGDTELVAKIRLLIIDEVHLLHDDRGSVIESIVARTLRFVESSQSMIRIVGLSATLPNYIDVAEFLRVNPYKGLFFFDSGFRPVPLQQNFVGVKAKSGSRNARDIMDRITFDHVVDIMQLEKQSMIFVHSRKDTVNTATTLRDFSLREGMMHLFDMSEDPRYSLAVKEVSKSKNKELRELFAHGFGIHHAGMLRSDRNLVERLFADGLIKVLCTTATLAWGINLPAYSVLIKGTQIYDAQKGSFVDLSILDVLQIFGRAGRPQYEEHGMGTIVTSHDKLSHYVSAMTQQHPIESRFADNLIDNLNAEISLGTVTNVDEAVTWLGYTYLYIRMRKNPLVYGLTAKEVMDDPLLGKRRRDLIVAAGKALRKCQMVVFDEETGYFTAKDLGRIASNYYISHDSIEIFNELMTPRMTEADVLAMLSMASEFKNIKLRDEEHSEMKGLESNAICMVKGGAETSHGKVNILLQSFISRSTVEDFALISDTAYVAQNGARILRSLFEIALNRNWGPTANVMLNLCKSIDRRMWSFEHALQQFDLPWDIVRKLEEKPQGSSVDQLRDMDEAQIGEWIRHKKMARTVWKSLEQFPTVLLDAVAAPITRTVLRITLDVTPDFLWNDQIHGGGEPFWIWVEDQENVEILHCESILITKRLMSQSIKLAFSIPIPKVDSTIDELPTQIYIRAVSDRWIGAETVIAVSFKHLILPRLNRTPNTDLLDLQPLPVTALQNPVLEDICMKRFTYFNPIQTQIFHTLYHSSTNVLVGAPTGSGKTVAAELSMWAAFRDFPKSKIVYIAPLKALVRERVVDWNARLMGPMKRKLVELTGDVTPDLRTIKESDVIVTTPEKWDGISRSWQSRSYVQDVSLIIIDEIHLLGGDRGPVLEVIVSRMNYISSKTNRAVRIVGLSTALANAADLGDWLGIPENGHGLFNFRHSVRPVPLEIHIDGFAGKHYCPRMQSMNKPTYQAIRTHSPTKPVIVFVSSRRQTRLTAQDLSTLCANNDNPRMFLHMPETEMELLIATSVKDAALKSSLAFGIGLHHAGLVESDRKLVEELFVNNKIQVLIATSTLAWGINTPAHLVVIKGTEYFDAAQHGYVDFPITDVLQMVGRAGRPQYDTTAVARVFVHDVKKNFYKKFLFEPFPVESSLHTALHDHLNAEVVGGTCKSKQDAVDYLTWTYLYRRLQMNPSYYGVEEADSHGVELFLSRLIEATIQDLQRAGCTEQGTAGELEATTLGRIAAYYYVHYTTMQVFHERLTGHYKLPQEGDDLASSDFARLLRIMCDVFEFSELPVRHNEDMMNLELQRFLPVPAVQGQEASKFGDFKADGAFDSPHLKTFFLLQAHFSRLRNLPCSDYVTDTKSVLDQALRVLHAMVDVSADKGFLSTSMGVMQMMQCVKQARWITDSPFMQLPHVDLKVADLLKSHGTIRDLAAKSEADIIKIVNKYMSATFTRDVVRVLLDMPVMTMKWNVIRKKPSPVKSIDELLEDEEVEIRADFKRLRTSRQSDLKIHARYPKPQYEGWWLVLGDASTDELIAVKRITSSQGSWHSSLAFTAPSVGRYTLNVYLMSDAYLGMDLQDKIELLVL